jgi:hypothetical protein
MQQLADDIADALRWIDQSGIPFKSYEPGVGPYGEPQLTARIAEFFTQNYRDRYPGITTRRNPDVLIPNHYALEFKIVRPFGNNNNEAEHWSQNLVHPYRGNVSAISDIYKLLDYAGDERKGIVVITYAHDPPRIDIDVLVNAFELISRQLLNLPLGQRFTHTVRPCIHPVHQCATVYCWPVEA